MSTIVLGLGSMGSAAALRLAARGEPVLGLERFGPAHDQGSGHGDSRVIRQAYFEDPAYVPLLLRAYELWEDLVNKTNQGLFVQTGGLFFGTPSSTVVSGSLASARHWDLPHEELDEHDIARRFPTMTPAPGDVGLFETRSGFVRPEATIAAQLELAARHGADLRFHQAALEWTATGGGVEVRTAEGTHTADTLVITPGAWAPDVIGGLPLRVTRQTLFWFAPKANTDAFQLDRGHPVYTHENADGLQIYGFPGIDDGPVKVAFFRVGQTTTPQTIDRVVTPEEVAEMRRATDPVLPDLAGDLVRSATCMYTNTPDEHFVVERRDNVVIACGFSGHGFKFVPVVGEILADLALDGSTQHPIDLFSPARL